MNEIERALATLQDLLDNSIFASRIDFALEVAIEALQDRLKAKKEDLTKNNIPINGKKKARRRRMIEKIYKKERMVICDNCGEGQVCDSWADAIDFMNEEGWKKKLVDGEWKHFCPECQESERKKG